MIMVSSYTFRAEDTVPNDLQSPDTRPTIELLLLSHKFN